MDYLILSFPGVGYVSTIVSRYLIEKIPLKPKEYIFIDRDVGRIVNGEIVPVAGVYEHKNFTLLHADMGISSEDFHLIEKHLERLYDKHETVVVLGGVIYPQKTGVFGIYSNEGGRQILKSYNVPLIEKGVISGVIARVLLSLKYRKPALALLGTVKHERDYEAAYHLVEVLNNILGINIDTEELEEAAQNVVSDADIISSTYG